MLSTAAIEAGSVSSPYHGFDGTANGVDGAESGLPEPSGRGSMCASLSQLETNMPRTISLLAGDRRLDLVPVLLFREAVARESLRPARPIRGKAARPLVREAGVQGDFEIDGSSPLGQALLEFLEAASAPQGPRMALDAMTVERARRVRAYSGVELWISTPPSEGAPMLIGFSASARMPV